MIWLKLVTLIIAVERSFGSNLIDVRQKAYKRDGEGSDTDDGNVPMSEKLPNYILDLHDTKHAFKDVEEQLEMVDDISKRIEELSKIPNTQKKLELLIGDGSKNKKLNDIKTVYDTVMKIKNVDTQEVLEGINALGGSLMEVVDSVSRGNWQGMLEGGLNVIQSLMILAGPVGFPISAVLSLVSAIFGLFGGGEGTRKVSENQEGMIKRVIDDALKRSRAEELKSEADGLKKEINSVRSSVNQFREENSITEDQATALYNQAFLGVNFFGKLKFYIDKYCDCTSDDGDEDKMRGEHSDRCLQFLNLYSDISILRQLLIADMASVIGSFKDMDKLALNLLKLTDKEKLSDKDIIMFLLDPINNKAQRFCIAQYFGSPNRFPTIQLYLSKLVKLAEGKKVPGKTVICSAKELLGLCQQLEFKNYENLGEWENKVKSLFVPQGTLVYGFNMDNLRGASFGPFPGPTVIGLLPGEWKSIEIRTSKININQFVRICETDNMEQTGRCDFIQSKEYPYLQMATGTDHGVWTKQNKKCIFPFKDNQKEYKSCVNGMTQYWCATEIKQDREFSEYGECLFPETWENKIGSISIPDGIQVDLYSEVEFNKNNEKGEHYGPFYGPNAINKLCGGKTAKSMKVVSTNTKTTGMVLICSEKSFSGMCDYIEAESYSRLDIHGCNWNKNSIKSMRVPEGLEVAMWTKTGYEGLAFGPYTGPVSVPEVDGYSVNEFQINSLIVRKTKKDDSTRRRSSLTSITQKHSRRSKTSRG